MWGVLFSLHCQIRPSKSKWDEKLHGEVDDLNPTEDGEAGEEPHGAADEAELGLQGHLHIPLYLVIGGSVEVDLDQLQGNVVYSGSWGFIFNSFKILVIDLHIKTKFNIF